MTIAHTDREQLGGHTLELTQTLGDSVGCRRVVSSMAVPIKLKPFYMALVITRSSDPRDAYHFVAPSTDTS
jgi:hypothetical protein